MNKYKINYHILESKSTHPRIVESPIFEYPNIICVGEHINLPFQYSRVSSIEHNINGMYACLDVVGLLSYEEDLEKKLNEAKEIFAKLNKSGGK